MDIFLLILENCELKTEIIFIYHQLHSHLYHVCRSLHKRASVLLWGCVWYILILLLQAVKEIFHFKWRLIGDVVGFFILLAAGYGSLTLFLYVS